MCLGGYNKHIIKIDDYYHSYIKFNYNNFNPGDIVNIIVKGNIISEYKIEHITPIDDYYSYHFKTKISYYKKFGMDTKCELILIKINYDSYINSFIENISLIKNNNNGTNTQLTATNHEKKCNEIISKYFNTILIGKEEFRNFICDNDRQWCSGNESIHNMCDESIYINNNSLNLEYDRNYLIGQPGGGQKYPDMCLIRLDLNNNLQITMIECKQFIPKFNNNLPKMKKNCLYICGNRIFNGFLLTTPVIQEQYRNYIHDYKKIIDKYKNEEFIPVLYKVVELNWRRGNGPICYTDRKYRNIPLITQCLSRYI
jgi:hypothetical protein